MMWLSRQLQMPVDVIVQLHFSKHILQHSLELYFDEEITYRLPSKQQSM